VPMTHRHSSGADGGRPGGRGAGHGDGSKTGATSDPIMGTVRAGGAGKITRAVTFSPPSRTPHRGIDAPDGPVIAPMFSPRRHGGYGERRAEGVRSSVSVVIFSVSSAPP